MARPEIISPQVKGLYDAVHKQALEFSKAFEYFKKQNAEFEEQKLELLKSVNQIREEFLLTSENLNQTANSTLKFIEQRADAISKVYQDIDELKSLKESYKVSLAELERQALEFSELMAIVKIKSNNDIQNSLLEFKNRIEKDINKYVQKLEIRLLIRLRDLEERFTFYDKLMLRLSHLKSQTKDILPNSSNEDTRLGTKSEQASNNLHKLIHQDYQSEDLIKSINDLKNEIKSQKSEEISQKSEIGKLIERMKQLESSLNNTNKFETTFDIKNINYKISQITLKLSTLEKAHKRMFFLIGMILALIIIWFVA